MLKTKKDILDLVRNDGDMMRVLRIVRDLKLNDWWIGAGFVRNKVFNYLHGYKNNLKLNDVDIIYFDKNNLSEETEIQLQNKLKKVDKDIEWSFTNQARMAFIKGDKPYKNSVDGLSRFNETATCIGVKLVKDKLVLIAPHGIKDLINLIIRISPLSLNHKEIFIERLKTKNWKKKWPKLKVIELV